MKRFLTFCLMVFGVLAALSACGSAGEVIDYDLVFVNDSDVAIVEVVVDFADQTSGAQNADSSPLKKGETFGFEAGAYPVTVTVYDRATGDFGQGELGLVTIREAPPEGERWYVTAQDGEYGLRLTVDTVWPDGV